MGAVDTFKVLGDPKRLRLAELMAEEVTVTELVEHTGFPQSTVSRHLTQFRDAGLVRVRREGNLRYYVVDQDAVGIAVGALRTFIHQSGLSSSTALPSPEGARRTTRTRKAAPPPPPRRPR